MEGKDLDEVLRIENTSFPNPWRKSTFQGEIDNWGVSFPLVIKHRDLEKVMGYIIYWQLLNEAQISNFAVHPELRRMGIGESVMHIVMDLMYQRGVQYVILEVRFSNREARSLYKKLGFEVWGRKKEYYRDPDEDALVMGKIFSDD
jgi:ribosomal-protein-alanine N-acetyltransferase